METKDIFDLEVLEVIRKHYTDIFPAERKVADLVLRNPRMVVNYNVAELAKKSGVSDATIVRMCHHLGYSGYYQFRLALSRDIGKNEIKSMDASGDFIAGEFEAKSQELAAISRNLEKEILRKCVELIKSADTVHIISMGNTTNLARYMGFRLERLGVKSTYSDLPEYYLNHINLSSPNDIVLAISKSGTSKSVLEGMKLARGKNLRTIVISANKESPIARMADLLLLSNGNQEPMGMYKGYSYFNEFVLIDILLNCTVNEERIEVKQANRPEFLLAENKL